MVDIKRLEIKKAGVMVSAKKRNAVLYYKLKYPDLKQQVLLGILMEMEGRPLGYLGAYCYEAAIPAEIAIVDFNSRLKRFFENGDWGIPGPYSPETQFYKSYESKVGLAVAQLVTLALGLFRLEDDKHFFDGLSNMLRIAVDKSRYFENKDDVLTHQSL